MKVSQIAESPALSACSKYVDKASRDALMIDSEPTPAEEVNDSNSDKRI